MVLYTILIVEDDPVLASVLECFFKENDFEVIHVVSGEEAIKVYEKKRPSLVLLDVILPGINGFEVMKKMLQIDNNIPVIIMTGTEISANSQIKGYNLGVVNYIQKPVFPQVLLAQIKNLLNPPEIRRFILNGNRITIKNEELQINDSNYTLKEKDINVLSVLLQKQHEMVSRKDIMLSVWGRSKANLNNHLDLSIHRLKKILSNHPEIKIENKYALGYRIC